MNDNVLTREAQIERDLIRTAKIIDKHGTKSLPIFKIFDAELARIKSKDNLIDRIRNLAA